MRYTFDCMRGNVRVATTSNKEKAKKWLIENQSGYIQVTDNIAKINANISNNEIDAFDDIGDEFIIIYVQGAYRTCSYSAAMEMCKKNSSMMAIYTHQQGIVRTENIYGEVHLANWRESLEKSITWKPSKMEKDHINPSHYQALMVVPAGDIVVELQWLEHLQYHAHFRDPAVFKGAVEMQARKYMDRCGGKDAELQEMKKAIWYLKFLAAYVANGNKPIYVKDIDTLLRN